MKRHYQIGTHHAGYRDLGSPDKRTKGKFHPFRKAQHHIKKLHS